MTTSETPQKRRKEEGDAYTEQFKPLLEQCETPPERRKLRSLRNNIRAAAVAVAALRAYLEDIPKLTEYINKTLIPRAFKDPSIQYIDENGKKHPLSLYLAYRAHVMGVGGWGSDNSPENIEAFRDNYMDYVFILNNRELFAGIIAANTELIKKEAGLNFREGDFELLKKVALKKLSAGVVFENRKGVNIEKDQFGITFDDADSVTEVVTSQDKTRKNGVAYASTLLGLLAEGSRTERHHQSYEALKAGLKEEIEKLGLDIETRA
jgi:hypothetical protein